MSTEKRNINMPIIGYKLIMRDGDAKNVKAVIRCIDMNGPRTLAEKTGYLVDMVNYLEDMGVDRYEMIFGIEELQRNGHNTAHFGMMGTFMFSEFSEAKQ